MQRFKNSLILVTHCSLVTCVVSFFIFISFIYSKDPIVMSSVTVGFITLAPLLIFFTVPSIIIPMIVINKKENNYKKNKKMMNGIYEILIYILMTTVIIICLDYLYKCLFDNNFSLGFANALKSVLNNSGSSLESYGFESFSKLPFLVQNFPTLIIGLLFATVISYPLSIFVAKGRAFKKSV